MNKTVQLYDGSITIHFNDQARNRYTIEETAKSPVGVTTVLAGLAKPALMLWPMYEGITWLKAHPEDFEGAEKAYLIKSDKGKDTGTVIHAAIEAILTEKQPTIPLDAVKAVAAFKTWLHETTKPLAVERIVYSKKYDVAGTYDCLLEIDGKVVLCDIKTTNSSRTAPLGIYAEHFLQLGAYSLAHHEENPMETIEDLMIIRVGKDGVLNTLRASELGLKVSDCEGSFLDVLGAYRFMTPLSKALSERKA